MLPEVKTCIKCEVEKPVADFYIRTESGKIRNSCKECDAKKGRRWAEKNRDKTRKSGRKWREKNIVAAREGSRRWSEKNKERVRIKSRNWWLKNRERARRNVRIWRAKTGEKQTLWRVAHYCRVRLRKVLKGRDKSYSTRSLLGCRADQLKAHLEKQFKPGMTWENYGLKGWHIDHIKPCAKFDLTDPEQQKQCFHYTNLQPLWAGENIEKGAK